MVFKKGNVPWAKGRRFSPEHRKRISLSHIGLKASPESRMKMSIAGKGRTFSKERNKKISLALKGRHPTELQRQHMSESHKGKIQTFESNQKRSLTMKNHWKNLEYKERVIANQNKYKRSFDGRSRSSAITTRLWNDPKYRRKVVVNALRNRFRRPTSFEQRVIDVIFKYDLPYEYVGNGKVIINYVNPDFIQNNGKKLLIEVANRVLLHHPIDYEDKRAKRFAQYGFKTLFLRDEDILRDDWEHHILSRIEEFNNASP